MSGLNTLHLHDLEAQANPKVDSGRNRLAATILTAAIVALCGSALFMLMGSDPPRSVASEPVVGSAPPSASADASSAAGPLDPAMPSPAEQVGAEPSAIPEAATLIVPAGTMLVLEIAEPMPSDGPVVGTEIVATLAVPLMVDGEVAAAAGSRVVGHVTETAPVAGESGGAIVGVAFDRIEVGGEPTLLTAVLQGAELDLAPGRRLELELSGAVEFPVAAEIEG